MAEKAAKAKAAAIGLLQPLEALSLDTSDFFRLSAAIVSFCDAQGAGSVAQLVECASKFPKVLAHALTAQGSPPPLRLADGLCQTDVQRPLSAPPYRA